MNAIGVSCCFLKFLLSVIDKEQMKVEKIKDQRHCVAYFFITGKKNQSCHLDRLHLDTRKLVLFFDIFECV